MYALYSRTSPQMGVPLYGALEGAVIRVGRARYRRRDDSMPPYDDSSAHVTIPHCRHTSFSLCALSVSSALLSCCNSPLPHRGQFGSNCRFGPRKRRAPFVHLLKGKMFTMPFHLSGR